MDSCRESPIASRSFSSELNAPIESRFPPGRERPALREITVTPSPSPTPQSDRTRRQNLRRRPARPIQRSLSAPIRSEARSASTLPSSRSPRAAPSRDNHAVAPNLSSSRVAIEVDDFACDPIGAAYVGRVAHGQHTGLPVWAVLYSTGPGLRYMVPSSALSPRETLLAPNPDSAGSQQSISVEFQDIQLDAHVDYLTESQLEVFVHRFLTTEFGEGPDWLLRG